MARLNIEEVFLVVRMYEVSNDRAKPNLGKNHMIDFSTINNQEFSPQSDKPRGEN